ncbi:PRC-barrel domain-containing protein [Pseudotabrizicola algicola]|uniref:PRC-barrel domain containing protein n=1 Tax=Pseudotabrizicola algicola TaxID=2709381 RepID=A0A6B3RS50_9RHOB|nr:PRC-barrel domain-containing protein [Pseudotabrizicola algicola]NEX45882.1 PRC-barrel domain containing protein [Pseudotabrizicola algicola]
MKKLFGTSALVMALAMPAFAQDATAPMPADGNMATTQDTMAQGNMAMNSPYLAGIERGVRASDFIGKRVYVTEQDTSTMSVDAIAVADTEWDDAGEISDLIISLSGDAEAVLVDFGGFLGIGEKTVALSMANLVMVPDSNSPDDYFIVFHGTKAELEGAPEFDENMVFEATATNTGVNNTTGMAADGTAPVAPATDGMAATAPADGAATTAPADGTVGTTGGVVADGTMTDGAMTNNAEMADLSTMTETDLIGKRVVGVNDEDIGEVSAVAIGANGAIEGAIVDVGGFLGIGEKRVALGSDALTTVRNADGTVDHFRVSMTQDQLETLPEYQG